MHHNSDLSLPGAQGSAAGGLDGDVPQGSFCGWLGAGGGGAQGSECCGDVTVGKGSATGTPPLAPPWRISSSNVPFEGGWRKKEDMGHMET